MELESWKFLSHNHWGLVGGCEANVRGLLLGVRVHCLYFSKHCRTVGSSKWMNAWAGKLSRTSFPDKVFHTPVKYIAYISYLGNSFEENVLWKVRRLASHRTPAVKTRSLTTNRRQSLVLRQPLDPHYHHKQNSGQSMSMIGKAFSAILFFALLLTRDLSVSNKTAATAPSSANFSFVFIRETATFFSKNAGRGWLWPTKIDSERVFSENYEIPHVKSSQSFFLSGFEKERVEKTPKEKSVGCSLPSSLSSLS